MSSKKFIKIPLNRWVIAIGAALGLLFGNDAVIAIVKPLVDILGASLPAA